MLWFEKVKQAIKLQSDLYSPMYAKIKEQTAALQEAAATAAGSVREYERFAAPNGVTDKAYTDYADRATDTNADSAANRLLTFQNQLESIDEQWLSKMEPLFRGRL